MVLKGKFLIKVNDIDHIIRCCNLIKLTRITKGIELHYENKIILAF